MPPASREARTPYPLRVPAWCEIPGLVHGFLGRDHGLPPGPFTLADVAERLRRAGERPSLALAVRQVHGAAVVAPEDLGPGVLDPGAITLAALPPGDTLVSASADVILTVRTADCVPILLVAERARAVAAVHAGWRGLLAGVVGRAVAALGERYDARPAELRAAIGPAIGGCCYTFGVEHRPAFQAEFGPRAAAAWSERGGRPHLDLRLVAKLALERAGVGGGIDALGPCTAEDPGLHSYRRDGAAAGRQLSYVGWRA